MQSAMTEPEMYYTVTRELVASDMVKANAILLPAASSLRKSSKGTCYLQKITPQRRPKSTLLAADPGAWPATMNWGGQYRFTQHEYADWLFALQPQWAGTMDLCAMDKSGRHPGEALVRQRQDFTTRMAWEAWSYYQDAPWYWVPTIVGYTRQEYEAHACDLAPLIWEMVAFYNDPAWDCDDTVRPITNFFRVGIGSLCGRAKPEFIAEVVTAIRQILGSYIQYHCWGVKLRTLNASVQFPGVASYDTGAWSGLYGKEHEARRSSGKTVTAYSWEDRYPRYHEQIQRAFQRQYQLTLFDVVAQQHATICDPFYFDYADDAFINAQRHVLERLAATNHCLLPL